MSENQRKRTKLNDIEKKALQEMFGEESKPEDAGAPEQTVAGTTEELGFGAQLRQAREAKGFAIGDMVGRLRASVKQVRALENETMEDLPDPVYIRGFLRSYAKILELNGDELVKDFNERYAPNKEESMMHQIPSIAYQSEQVLHDHAPSRWWKIGGGVVLALAIGAGSLSVYLQSRLTENEARLTSAPPAVAKAPAPVARVAPAAPAAPAAPTMQRVPDVQLSPDNGAPYTLSEGKPEIRLRIATKASCWVRISRLNDDATVFEQEIPAGTVRIVRGQKPLRMIVGNPDGTSLQINETEIELKRFLSSRDGTVRFRMH